MLRVERSQASSFSSSARKFHIRISYEVGTMVSECFAFWYDELSPFTDGKSPLSGGPDDWNYRGFDIY